MMKSDFNKLENFFNNDDLLSIEKSVDGDKFLKLRTMSRKNILAELFVYVGMEIPNVKSKDYFRILFNNNNVTSEIIDRFIIEKYKKEREGRMANQDYIVDQLMRLDNFDWGGSFGNSLEKNIVNNYVKKIKSYDEINKKIENELFISMRGYTLNSWYNHWTSILIEDLFKDHAIVLPTIGLVKKIDFFIHNVPFDLKVTYFPEELLAEKLKEKGFGVELTRIKQLCRKLDIFIPSDMNDKELKLLLMRKISEDHRREAKIFYQQLTVLKKEIIQEAKENPHELKRWLYENQGEARFDASNRFFLILIDENDLSNSWTLKRNISFLNEKIKSHLDKLEHNFNSLEMKFYWRKTNKEYSCKSDILFITR